MMEEDFEVSLQDALEPPCLFQWDRRLRSRFSPPRVRSVASTSCDSLVKKPAKLPETPGASVSAATVILTVLSLLCSGR